MSGSRVSDLSKLHLKRELTQIRKAGRVLRDPGTSSSWRSPLHSSRSVAATVVDPLVSRIGGISGDNAQKLPSSSSNRGKEKKVFLYNWKTQRSSSEKSGLAKNGKEVEEEEEESSWTEASVNDDDDVSDARNGNECYGIQSASMLFKCRDTNLASQGVSKTRKNNVCIKKKSKKQNSSRLDLLSKYEPRGDIVPRKSNSGSALAVRRGDTTELSDDTEELNNAEDLRKLKNKNWSRSLSNKLLIATRKEDSSCTYNSTPALSTSSFNMYAVRNPSNVGSWDGTTTSVNDGDDELDDHLDLPGRRGCGIPCYWTKKAMKHRGGCRSCCSPSFSDTLRRTGSSILCGSQSVYRRHSRHSSGGFSKHKIASRSAQGVLPLLTYGGDGRRGGSSIGTGLSDDEVSTNFGEIDLEAQSRLDGRRWSTSCRSQDGLEAGVLDGEGEEGSTPENIRSFSQKYKPMFFDELIGQSIVVQSLMNAVKRSRIAPVYLFQGPRGTGKTSTARIFSAALNCVATEEMKPCGYCKECNDFMSGKRRDFWELDGANKKGADKVRYVLKNLPTILPRSSSTYKVFVIDECHLLPSKTWLSFLKFLEKPLERVVFIFITTDLDNVPRTIQSRCQKFLFDKLKDADIVVRLKKIASDENLDVESHALDLIAMNADGSLRDAETMLEQLSLLGKCITTGLVNELVGVVSDEKLLELLELALSSDTAETVKRARELLDLGADPIVLMSQLASLIMDIIAGTYKVVDEKYSDAFLDGRNLTEADMEGLKHALKLLSEAEKQLRVSNDRSTWFTATLLQLGSMPSPGTTHTGSSSRRQSSRATDDDPSSLSREVMAYKQRIGGLHFSKSASPASVRNKRGNHTHEAKSFSRVIDNTCYKSSSSSQVPESDASISSHDNSTSSTMMLTQRSSEKLNDIWRKCIERCHSKTLRQLLYTHGKLISISEVEGILVAYIAFGETDIKSRAERFLSSITNSMEMVLRRSVEVRIILLPETELLVVPKKPEMTSRGGDLNAITGLNAAASSDLGVGSSEESRSKAPMQRIESIIREQRLETAWLQTADKDTPGSIIGIKPERNQILPQEDAYRQPNVGSPAISSSGLTSHHWVDELNNEVKLLKIGENGELQENLTGKRGEHCPLSPSMLHDSNFGHKKDNPGGGYESGPGTRRVGCNMLFCWNTHKTQRSNKKHGKGTPVRPRRSRKRGFSMFNGCAKPRKAEGKFRR
ncbi:unnamed protein product [Eruca vesicaria subsp. sativa]|uniref:AAA+ ATPase domain-containing protein n=1 Tax=Eruca vesicaria subsp. sativa TaxID=29727 RepID=A0ABC8LUQ3_ERUVS|nr:unnamed protein product [Eruca vesicaria subsp. sativa]